MNSVKEDFYRAVFGFICASIFLGLQGCTTLALQNSTLAASSTVSTILEQQVLDNLGRFKDHPYAIPSQVVINSGVISVQNQLNATVKLPYTLLDKAAKERDLVANMQWQGAWTVNPVTDSEDLWRLQYLYRNAVIDGNNIVSVKKYSAEPILNKYEKYTPPNPQTGTPAPSQFDDKTQIDELLNAAPQWLRIGDAPTVESADSNPFVDKGRHFGHQIWVREKEFSLFMMYVLYATPASKINNGQFRGFSLSIQ